MTLTERLCLVCGIMPYLDPAVCSVCRDRLAYLLGSIHRRWKRQADDAGEPTVLVTSQAELVDETAPELVDELDEDGKPTGAQVEIQVPTGRRLLTGRRIHTTALLAGPVRSITTGSRVSGSHGSPAPVDLDDVDLTSRARVGSIGLAYRGRWSHRPGGDPDQVGQLPAATLLDWWAHEFAAARELDEHLPTATVPELVRWLAVPARLQWACDYHPEVKAYAGDLTSINTRLARLVLGRGARPEVLPTPCPSCDLQTLERSPDDSWIQCGDDACGRVLSPQEYAQHARAVLESYRQQATERAAA